MKKSAFLILLFCLAALSRLLAEPRTLERAVGRPRQHGYDVEWVQKQLIYAGYDLGEDGADGWFGPISKEAVC